LLFLGLERVPVLDVLLLEILGDVQYLEGLLVLAAAVVIAESTSRDEVTFTGAAGAILLVVPSVKVLVTWYRCCSRRILCCASLRRDSVSFFHDDSTNLSSSSVLHLWSGGKEGEAEGSIGDEGLQALVLGDENEMGDMGDVLWKTRGSVESCFSGVSNGPTELVFTISR